MAKGDKVNSSIKADKRNKLILGLVIAVLAIFAIGYFVFISGLLPKYMTGVKVVQNDANGVQQVVGSVSVAETNFHYYQVLNTYNQQGYLQYITDIDAVADETTGKTYRQIILDQAATEIMDSILVNRLAEQSGYLEISGADRAAQLSLDSITATAANYNYNTADRYLSAMYGAGMSSRLYREAYARQVLTNEYEQYVRQFVFAVSEDEVQQAYDENPLVYQRVDFNCYYFAAEIDEDGIYDFSSAEAKADIVAAATDSDEFRDLCIEALGEDEATLAGFVDDANPTLCQSYTSATTDMMAPGISDFVFGDDTEFGTTTIISTETGVYVVLLNDRYVDETPTVAYRTITLYNPALASTTAPTAEELAAGITEVTNEANGYAATAMDSLTFVNLVKDRSDSINEIISGGYVDNVTEANYTPYYEAAEDPTNLDPSASLRAQVGHWLFDASRVHGDTYVYIDPTNQFVTIYYFESNVPGWVYTAQNQLLTAMVNGWRSEVLSGDATYAIAYDLVRRLSYSA